MNSHSDTKYHAYIDEIKDNLKVTLQKGLEFINWEKYIDKNSRVFVKPNFTFPHYKEGVTTNPQFLKYLLEILKSKADTVILGESDGGNHSFRAEDSFQGHNIYQICRENGVELVNLSTLPTETIGSRVLGKEVKRVRGYEPKMKKRGGIKKTFDWIVENREKIEARARF